MRLRWGWIEIDLEVAVGSIAPLAPGAEDEAALYVGSWAMTQESQPRSSAVVAPVTLTVSSGDGGALRASFSSRDFVRPPPRLVAHDSAAAMSEQRERADAPPTVAEQMQGSFEYLLVPQSRGVFLMARTNDSVLLDVEKIYHEFELEDGRAVRLVVRDGEGRVMARGTRATE